MRWKECALRLGHKSVFWSALGILVASLLFGCGGGGGGGLTAPTQILEQENNSFRLAVINALEEALGRQANIKVRKDNFTALLLDGEGSIVVVAGIEDAEKLSLEQLARGADVMFIFVRGTQGSQLPSGFYIVRVQQVSTSPGTAPATQWIAQIRDMRGEVKAETEVEVGNGNPNLQVPKIMVSFEDGYVNFGYYAGGFFLYRTRYTGGYFLYSFDNPDPDLTPLPQAGSKIVNAAKRFYKRALEVSGSSGPMILATTYDGLFLHAAAPGLENLTLDQLKQGADMSVNSYPPKYATIYKIRISLSPDGRWVAKFVDEKGEILGEAPATVEEQQQETQKVKLSFEWGDERICVDAKFGKVKVEVCIE